MRSLALRGEQYDALQANVKRTWLLFQQRRTEMREHWPVAVCLSVLVIASTLIIIGLVCRTIALHPDAMGFLP